MPSSTTITIANDMQLTEVQEICSQMVWFLLSHVPITAAISKVKNMTFQPLPVKSIFICNELNFGNTIGTVQLVHSIKNDHVNKSTVTYAPIAQIGYLQLVITV